MADRRRYFNPNKSTAMDPVTAGIEAGAPQPQAGPRTIGSEPQALDVAANAGRFILVGNNHARGGDAQNFINMMPAFEHANVRAVGLELPPSMNGFLAQEQNKVRNGATAQQVEADMRNYLRGQGLAANPAAGDMPLAANAAILVEATRRNMQVSGIDPRFDDPKFRETSAAWERLAASQGGGVTQAQYREWIRFQDSYNDRAAANAAQTLSAMPPDSRMAIFYGPQHLNNDANPGPNAPPTLAQNLQPYGGAAIITPDNFEQSIKHENPTLMPSDVRINGPKLQSDVDLRARRDAIRPPTTVRP